MSHAVQYIAKTPKTTVSHDQTVTNHLMSRNTFSPRFECEQKRCRHLTFTNYNTIVPLSHVIWPSNASYTASIFV